MKEKWRLPLGLLIYLAMVVALLISGVILYRLLHERHSTGRFTILQINDVYKVEGIERETIGGLARVRALRESLEKEGRPVLMLHGGDFLFPSVMSKFLEARPMVRCLNLLDGDAKAFDDQMVVTFGNHEFDKDSRDFLSSRILESDFRWVTSNILFRDQADSPGQPLSQKFKNVSEHLILELDGIHVGIVALTTPDTDRTWVDYRYEDRYRLVREALVHLQKEGAQVLIALTHQDYEEDEKLAKQFPEIDLIVGGHDHSNFQKRIGKTWITKADADARSAYRIDVAVLKDGSVIAAPEKIDLGPKAPKDPALQTAVRQAREELEKAYEKKEVKTKKKLSDPVATTESLLEGIEPAIRGRETALGNLLADSIRQRMNTRVAFVNSGTVRINDNIPAGGTLTQEDMEGIFYFDNQLIDFALSREQLLRLLQTSVSQADRGSGRFLQVSCIRFRYRPKPGTDPTTYEVGLDDVWICPEGKPDTPISEWVPLSQVKEDEKITSSTLYYLWENGYKEGYDLFARGNKGKSPDPLTQVDKKEDLPDWRTEFEKQLQGKKIAPKVEGRIQRVEG